MGAVGHKVQKFSSKVTKLALRVDLVRSGTSVNDYGDVVSLRSWVLVNIFQRVSLAPLEIVRIIVAG